MNTTRRPWRRAGLLSSASFLSLVVALAGCSPPDANTGSPGVSQSGSAAPSGSTTPVTTPGPSSASPSPVASPSLPAPTSNASDAAAAKDAIDGYIGDLVAKRWYGAWVRLAPLSHQHWGTIADFKTERKAFFASAGPRHTVKAPDNSSSAIGQWLPSGFDGDQTRAYVVEVDYPKITAGNAGYEIFVVAPDASGAWLIWVAR